MQLSNQSEKAVNSKRTCGKMIFKVYLISQNANSNNINYTGKSSTHNCHMFIFCYVHMTD